MDSNTLIGVTDSLLQGEAVTPINFLTDTDRYLILERPTVLGISGKENGRVFTSGYVTDRSVLKIEWLLTSTNLSYSFTSTTPAASLDSPVLEADKFYVIRCRYKLEDYGWTDWSKGYPFKTEKEFDYPYVFFVVHTGFKSGSLYSLEGSKAYFRKSIDVPGRGRSVVYNKDNHHLYVGHTDIPYYHKYSRNISELTDLNNAEYTLHAIPEKMALNPETRDLAMVFSENPYLQINGNNPGTDLNGPGTDCAFSSDGLLLAVSSSYTPYLSIYSKPYGTYELVESGGDTPCYAVSIWKHGSMIAAGGAVYTYSSISGLSLQDTYADNVWSSDFHITGDLIAFCMEDSPYVKIVRFSGGEYTVGLSSPARVCKFTPDGRFLLIGHRRNPYLSIFETNEFSPIEIDYVPEGTVWDLDVWQNITR